MSEEKEIACRIARVLRLLAGQIEDNPELLKETGLAVRDIPTVGRQKKPKEATTSLDVFNVFATEGQEGLRTKLEALELRTLKTIVSLHGFDLSKRAAKWRDKERLINLITEKVAARSDRGLVFKDYP